MSGTTARLEVRDLTVEYSSGGYAVRPLDGVSLDVGPGELVLLLGASGCGKTTLLSALAGILRPTSGSIRLGDTEVTTLRGAALTHYRRHTVGLVFQAFNLIPSLSAAENVEVAMRLAGTKKSVARDRARSLLTDIGLGERLAHRSGDLSGGQQQRVAIARALANDPPVVLADEPTAHLDYVQVEGVLRLLRRITDEGRIVVVSTHDERMVPLADRVLALTAALPASRSAPPVERRLAAGEMLFRQGDEPDLVYIVEEGTIEILRDRVEGEPERLATVEPGHYFGELGPMFGLRRAATALAGSGGARITGFTLRDFRETMRLTQPEVITATERRT